MAKYLVNSISLGMLSDGVRVANFFITELSLEEFCREVPRSDSAIGHESTAKLISTLCNISVAVDRREVKLKDGDELIIMQLMTRLPEGRILSLDELKQLMSDKKIRFFRVTFDDLTYY